MKLSESVKPISYLKSHASEIVRDICSSHMTYVITHNGNAKVVVQDVTSYEQTQDSLALLKMLACSTKSMKEGKYKPVKTAFRDISARIKETV
jgi:PHD/YefM family antitoxin component YafN of YafNO toxin-antitoxin module